MPLLIGGVSGVWLLAAITGAALTVASLGMLSTLGEARQRL